MKHQHLLNGDSDTDTGLDSGSGSRQYRSTWDDKE